MRALTGLDLAAVCALSEPFVAGCQQEADARFSEQRTRQRRAGGGRKGVLASPKQKLLFILYYLKAYPTFDELAATFGLSRSKACEHAHRLARALERTLRTARRAAGPRHRLAGPDAGRLRRCDRAAARCHCRPYRRARAAVDRPADYSGKKRPTRKNTLIADPLRYIHYLGPTVNGTTHDYQMLKKEFDVNLGLLDLFQVLADLGY